MRKSTNLLSQTLAILAGMAGLALAQGTSGDPRADVATIRQALNDALTSNRDGQSSSWNNPQTGNYGQITPRTSRNGPNGQPCRAYVRTWVFNGGETTLSGEACKDAEGVWRVQGTEANEGRRTVTASLAPPPQAAPNPAPTAPPPSPPAGRAGNVQPPRPAQNAPAVPPANAGRATAPPAAPSASAPAVRQATPQQPQPLRVVLSRDEALALERNMSRLGLAVGPIDGTVDETTQQAIRTFWRDQQRTGDPVIDEPFLTLVQIAVSADQSKGGVLPVMITTPETIGQVPELSHFP